MNRRAFAGLSLAALGGIFAPKFGHWYRRGSGVIVPDRSLILHDENCWTITGSDVALPYTLHLSVGGERVPFTYRYDPTHPRSVLTCTAPIRARETIYSNLTFETAL